ncbi:MAG TPA: GNAT family N-acetyltransferase [Rhizomicrobium sp.]|jgi:RimJ/RimL family protein N-acetyltransferase
MMALTLETPRLLLREHTLTDFPIYAAMKADPVVMRYFREGPIDGETAWTKFTAMAGHWHFHGYGNWAIAEKASGRVIGSVGYADKKRPAAHPASGAPEMGWSLAVSAHGQGFASEALRAALEWGRGHFGPSRVVCVIDNNNAASIRLAERHGFKQFAETTRTGLPRLVFERML